MILIYSSLPTMMVSCCCALILGYLLLALLQLEIS